MAWRTYTPREIRFVRMKIFGRSYAEMTDLFNEHFSLRGKKKITLGQMKGFLGNRKLRNGRDTRLRPGNVPFNKGRKGCCPPGSEKGWFNPGHRPWTWKPVGTERINRDGYTEVRIRNPSGKPWKNWKTKHRIIWEKAHGKIPRGHVILFADGDKSNFALDNLLLVSRGELAVMNRGGLIFGDGDLTRAGKTIADIKIVIAKRTKGKKSRNRRNSHDQTGRTAKTVRRV
jgi:hypothetical protein